MIRPGNVIIRDNKFSFTVEISGKMVESRLEFDHAHTAKAEMRQRVKFLQGFEFSEHNKEDKD